MNAPALEDGARRELEALAAGALVLDPGLANETGLTSRDFVTPGSRAIVVAHERAGGDVWTEPLLSIHCQLCADDELAFALGGKPGRVALALARVVDAAEIATPAAVCRRLRLQSIDDGLRLCHADAARGFEVSVEIARLERERARVADLLAPEPALSGSVVHVDLTIGESADSRRIARRVREALAVADPGLRGRVRVHVMIAREAA